MPSGGRPYPPDPQAAPGMQPTKRKAPVAQQQGAPVPPAMPPPPAQPMGPFQPLPQPGMGQMTAPQAGAPGGGPGGPGGLPPAIQQMLGGANPGGQPGGPPPDIMALLQRVLGGR